METESTRSKKLWQVQYNQEYGRCYTLTVPKEIKELSIEQIAFNLKKDTDLFFHHPGQWTRNDLKRNLVEVKLGKKKQIHLTYDVSKLLIIIYFKQRFPETDI